jgi:hypothetical protein
MIEAIVEGIIEFVFELIIRFLIVIPGAFVRWSFRGFKGSYMQLVLEDTRKNEFFGILFYTSIVITFNFIIFWP